MRPYKNMPVQEAVQYARLRNITESDTNVRGSGALDKLSKFTAIPIATLVQELAQATFSLDKNLVPNKQHGPLTMHNKVIIRDKHPDPVHTKPLANYLNTSYQNVRLAQKGDFIEHKQSRAKEPTGTRVLSTDEKIDIFENYQHMSPSEVAQHFKTRYQYAQRALRGDFKRSTARRTMTLTAAQQQYLGIDSDTITYYTKA